jgi:hypothetical protein
MSLIGGDGEMGQIDGACQNGQILYIFHLSISINVFIGYTYKLYEYVD